MCLLFCRAQCPLAGSTYRQNWHFIFVQVVLVVRGTTSLADTLTDLSGHLVPFGGGGAEGDVPERDVPQAEGGGTNGGGGSSSTTSSDGCNASGRSSRESAADKGSSPGKGDSNSTGAGSTAMAADSSSSSSSSTGSGSSSSSSSDSDSGSTAGAREAGEPEGMAHNGILRAAQSLLREQGPALGELLRDHPGFRLKVCRHADWAASAFSQALPPMEDSMPSSG